MKVSLNNLYPCLQHVEHEWLNLSSAPHKTLQAGRKGESLAILGSSSPRLRVSPL